MHFTRRFVAADLLGPAVHRAAHHEFGVVEGCRAHADDDFVGARLRHGYVAPLENGLVVLGHYPAGFHGRREYLCSEVKVDDCSTRALSAKKRFESPRRWCEAAASTATQNSTIPYAQDRPPAPERQRMSD